MPRKETPLLHFCFTLNNYVEEDVERIASNLDAISKYWIIGKEVGEQGTRHLQGYASLKRRYTFTSLKANISDRVHIERARGSARQNRDYCSKDGDYREGGKINEGGRPSSRDELATAFVAAVRSGAEGVAAYADTFPGTYMYSGSVLLRNALSLYPPVDRPDITVRWIYGGPGIGKSREAHKELPEAYIKEPRTKWWNGYMMQKEVIIDDFGPNSIDINHLLRWFDRYKCLVETKGGMLALYATTFIVTSNFSPYEVFTDKDGIVHPQIEALVRRITIDHMK